MDNKKITFLVLILLLFSACSSNDIKFSKECMDYSNSVLPETLLLSFENSHNGEDDVELPYLLSSITWKDKSSSIQDRYFRKPTTSGKDSTLYYPIKLDKSPNGHGDKITYKKQNEYTLVYDLVLEKTNQVVYGTKAGIVSGKPEDDFTKGTRLFTIKEANLLECF